MKEFKKFASEPLFPIDETGKPNMEEYLGAVMAEQSSYSIRLSLFEFEQSNPLFSSFRFLKLAF